MNDSDSDSTSDSVRAYIASLSAKEMTAYRIASTHLASSFSAERSNGYLLWKAQQKKEKAVAPVVPADKGT